MICRCFLLTAECVADITTYIRQDTRIIKIYQYSRWTVGTVGTPRHIGTQQTTANSDKSHTFNISSIILFDISPFRIKKLSLRRIN